MKQSVRGENRTNRSVKQRDRDSP